MEGEQLMRVLFLMTIAAVMLGASGSSAHPEMQLQAVRQACHADVQKFCQGIRPGQGRIRACLRSNKDRVSDGCKSAVAALIQTRKDARNPSTPVPQGD